MHSKIGDFVGSLFHQTVFLVTQVNFLELPEAVQDSLAEEYGTLEQGLLWLAEHLNSDTLDLWSRAWAANNNVNNYEIENLPFPPPVSVTQVV